jgi:dihydroneopterin aldolase
MAIRSKLIEHVAYRMLEAFKTEFPSAFKSKITIRKLNAPIGGVVKEVAIIIEG